MQRFLIVGYGGMGARHAEQLRASEYAEVAGVYDTNPERLAAAKMNGFIVQSDADALLSMDADCALVTTPNDTHLFWVRRLLESGRHVLVEKPAGMSADEVRAMYRTAEQYGKLLGVNMNRRWDADFLGVKRVIDEGGLGDILCLESRVHGSRGIPGGWRLAPAQGGGMLYDWGVHLIDQVMSAFDFHMPKAVYCQLSHALGYEVDDGFRLALDFSDAARAYIEVATCNFISLPRFYLTARFGAARVEDWQHDGQLVRCLQWEEQGPNVRLMSPRDEKTTIGTSFALPASKQGEIARNFCAAVRGEEAIAVTPGQVESVMRVIDGAFASARKGAPVALEEVGCGK